MKTVFIIFLITFASFAQESLLFQERDNNRLEGIKDIQAGAPDLELLSFLSFREEVKGNEDVSLKLKFYMEQSGEISLTARELDIIHFYFMTPLQTKWKKGWQEFSPWPTKDVLTPLEISVEQLGITGKLSSTRHNIRKIAPIILYHSNHPAAIEKYELQFRPKSSLRSVRYELYRMKDNKQLVRDQLWDVMGGAPFSIVLDMKTQPEGQYKLVLNCKYKDSPKGPQRTYMFYHQPNVFR